MKYRLTFAMLALLLAAHGMPSGAVAQTPPVVPLPPPTQFSTQTSCLINCGTQAGNCRQNCTTPAFVTSRQTPGQDTGAGTQCILGCSNNEMICQRSCLPQR